MQGVLLHSLGTLGGVHGVEGLLTLDGGNDLSLLDELLLVGDDLAQHFGDGGSSGQAGALDTDGFVSVLNALHSADNEVAVLLMGTDAGEVGDGVAGIGIGPGQAALLQHAGQTVSGGGDVQLVRDILSGGAQQQVAMHGGRNQNALTHLGGALEHRHREGDGIHAIHQPVLAATIDDVQLLVAHHVVDLGGANAGAVDQHLAGVLALIGLNMPQAVFALDNVGDLGIQVESSAVDGSVIGQSESHFVGAGQAAGGRIQGAQNFGIGVGLHLEDLFALNDAAVRNVVELGLLKQLFKGRAVILGEADDKRAGTTVGNAQLSAECGVHLRTLHVQLGLERAGLGVKTSVDNAAVRLAGALGHVARTVNDRQRAFIAAENPSQRAACNACTDDQNVGIQFRIPPIVRDAYGHPEL